MAAKLLIAFIMCITLWILAAFAVFSAFRYMNAKDDKPERIFFISLGVITFLISLIVFFGIIST